MSHETDKQRRQLARLQGFSGLLTRRQPLGFLPSMAYWNRREHWRPIAGTMAGAAVAALVAVISLGEFLSPWVGGLVAGALIVLANGLIERRIRAQLATAGITAPRDDDPAGA